MLGVAISRLKSRSLGAFTWSSLIVTKKLICFHENDLRIVSDCRHFHGSGGGGGGGGEATDPRVIQRIF